MLFSAVLLASCKEDALLQATLYESTADLNNKNLPDITFRQPKNYPNRKKQWALLEQIHENPAIDNQIIFFYTRNKIPKNHRASGQNQSNNDYWNKEHVWPRSYGLKGTKADRDLHNIVASDRSVNASRGNKYFKESIGNHHECKQCQTSNKTWEPPDIVKGDVARIAFYMALTYADENVGKNSLVLAKREKINASLSIFGDLESLIVWHCQDSVSDYEINRDKIIERYQGNNNPFVRNKKSSERDI